MRESRPNKSVTPAQRQSVRIIGGRWRGRRISFPEAIDVRPTGDRLRETLFNWLAPVIPRAICLDLFAGSGVLGLEALSRGAAKVIFVDHSPAVIKELHATFALLNCSEGEIVHAESAGWLSRPAKQAFDVVFLDPPFAADCLPRVITALQAYGWIAPKGWVYIERPAGALPLDMPDSWRLHREKKTGEVACSLYQCG